MDRAGNRFSKKQERVVLDVTVDKGMNNGQRITFAGKGDQMPGTCCSHHTCGERHEVRLECLC